MVEQSNLFQLNEPVRNEQIDVVATSSVISYARNASNPRKVILIRNTSAGAASIITINMSQNAATANNGIVLNQNESFSDSSETGYECYQGVITAICADANGKLSIMER